MYTVLALCLIGFVGAVVAWDGCRVLAEERWIREWRARQKINETVSPK